VLGQFRGYHQEKGVALDSNVEAFAALTFGGDCWNWKRRPFNRAAARSAVALDAGELSDA
jgi:glucose-6-phosphate 1-dehydrogenase